MGQMSQYNLGSESQLTKIAYQNVEDLRRADDTVVAHLKAGPELGLLKLPVSSSTFC